MSTPRTPSRRPSRPGRNHKENAPRQRIHLEVESLWSKPDVNPDFYATGFRIHNMGTQALLQLQLLIEEFKF